MDTFAFLNLGTPDFVMAVTVLIIIALLVTVARQFYKGYTSKK